MSKSIPIFLFAALALLAAGCGGDDGEAGNSPDDAATLANSEAAPSKAEFIEQAEAVCTKARGRTQREAAAYSREHRRELTALEPIPAEEKIIRAVVLPAVLKEAEELDALAVPAGDEKEIEAIINGMEAGVKKAERDPYDSTSLEDPSKYAFREVGLRIRAYGIVACRNVG